MSQKEREREGRKYSDRELIIEYKYKRCYAFAIKPMATGMEGGEGVYFLPYYYVFYDTLREDNNNKPKWDYNYITILEESNPHPRYHLTYYVADNYRQPNAGKCEIIKEEWYPMTSTVLEIRHYNNHYYYNSKKTIVSRNYKKKLEIYR